MNRDLPSRPFVVAAPKGTQIMANLIERRVKFSCVPRWPWSLVGRALPLLPDSVIARM